MKMIINPEGKKTGEKEGTKGKDKYQVRTSEDKSDSCSDKMTASKKLKLSVMTEVHLHCKKKSIAKKQSHFAGSDCKTAKFKQASLYSYRPDVLMK